MIDFFESQNNDFTQAIRTKLSEFFEAVKQEILQQEHQDKNVQTRKSWELSKEEMEKVDTKKAVENVERQQEERKSDELRAMFK